MSSCSPQVIKYTKNPRYWQKGLPKIDTVYYPAFTSNDPANQQLASGKAQWGSQFIPNIKAYYLSKSADNHIWFPPLVNVSIFMNLKDPILSNVAVRKALAYAIDRSRVSQIGEYGYEPAANQTGIVTPDVRELARQEGGRDLQLQPGEGDPDPHQGRIQTFRKRGLQDSLREAAVVPDRQHRRLLRLGRVGAGDPAGAEGGRDRHHR